MEKDNSWWQTLVEQAFTLLVLASAGYCAFFLSQLGANATLDLWKSGPIWGLGVTIFAKLFFQGMRTLESFDISAWIILAFAFVGLSFGVLSYLSKQDNLKLLFANTASLLVGLGIGGLVSRKSTQPTKSSSE